MMRRNCDMRYDFENTLATVTSIAKLERLES